MNDYLPTEDTRIFHTGWIQAYNQLCQIDHSFSIKKGEIYVLSAHRGLGSSILPLGKKIDSKSLVPIKIKNEHVEDNSKEVYQRIKQFLPDESN